MSDSVFSLQQYTASEITPLQQSLLKLKQEISSSGSKTRIAVFGLYNAGKSMLLNMLTGNFDEQHFPFATKDARETRSIKDLEFGSFIYRDTPGLDADDADDTEAKAGISDSDIILFVHGDQRELEQIEVDYLKKLKEAFGREQARHHLIVVQNKIDRFAENEAGFERVKNRIREQCKEALGFEPYFFAVSATRYYNGKLKQKEALANKSGMPELMAQITSLAPNAEEFRHYRIVYSLRELQKQIKEQIDTLEAANSRDKKAFISYFAAFNQNMDVYKQHIADFKRRFAALESDEY